MAGVCLLRQTHPRSCFFHQIAKNKQMEKEAKEPLSKFKVIVGLRKIQILCEIS